MVVLTHRTGAAHVRRRRRGRRTLSQELCGWRRARTLISPAQHAAHFLLVADAHTTHVKHVQAHYLAVPHASYCKKLEGIEVEDLELKFEKINWIWIGLIFG